MKKKINISCFLNDDEMAEVKEYIEKLLKEPDVELYESGGLGVRAERFKTHTVFDIYRIIGTAEVKIGKKRKEVV
ncbi:hypothetical protein ES703_09844 [subsurface metagenome]